MKHAVAWYQSRCLLATQTASQPSVSKPSPWGFIRNFQRFRGAQKTVARDFGTSISLRRNRIAAISCVRRMSLLWYLWVVIAVSIGCVPSGIRNCKGFPCFLFFDTVFLRKVRNADLFLIPFWTLNYFFNTIYMLLCLIEYCRVKEWFSKLIKVSKLWCDYRG